MEVGAVKQAFNNEVILLKKNLNQAKIQIIHKLTRKAKTLSEKKCPEALKEKLKRKAESAVKEVLLIKKIKPRDIAKFIVTHKGKLNDYLNKPNVDNDKACARLLLHKALTNKYQLIKDRFGNVSIKDLFMSRQERRQLKKEAREKQENKKKKRTNSETDNVGGVWDVEVDNKSEITNGVKGLNKDGDSSSDGGSDDEDQVETEEESTGKEQEEEIVQESDNESEVDSAEEIKMKKFKSKSKSKPFKPGKLIPKETDSDEEDSHDSDEEDSHDSDDEETPISTQDNTKGKLTINERPTMKKVDANINAEKRLKDNNKNKNLNEKLKKRKFNKDVNGLEEHKTQIVDPFFITSSGDNYMSLVEPRPPDEVKEVHKQGNRKYRRAVMFGLAPKPRRNDFKSNKSQQNSFNKGRTNNFNSKDNRNNNFRRNERESKVEDNPVPEKLHPSWEAKKRQSAIVPFKGKKIMFDDS